MRFLLGVVTGVIALSVLNAPRRRITVRPTQRRLPLLPPRAESSPSKYWTYQRLSTCVSLN